MSRILAGLPGPYLIGHRGAMAEAPENTRTAFDRALEFPIDGIEFDVRLSRDNVPVVFHDDTLGRTAGRNGSVSDFSAAELKTVDCGRWFSESYAGERILLFEELLAEFGGRTALLVELKTGPEKARTDTIRRELVGATLERIGRLTRADAREGIFILSFDRKALEMAYSAAPELNYILNLDRPFSESAAHDDFFYGYGLSFDQITGVFLEDVHRRGKKVMTYSCNTLSHVDMALDSGIDYLLTDDPAFVAAHFRARVDNRV